MNTIYVARLSVFWGIIIIIMIIIIERGIWEEFMFQDLERKRGLDCMESMITTLSS